MVIAKGSPVLASDINNLTFFPKGTILTFSTEAWNATSSEFKNIWNICDGTNGTPNLTNKFLRGGNASADGWNNPNTGNTQSLAIGTANLPNHSHTVNEPNSGKGHTHTQNPHKHTIDVHTNTAGHGSGKAWDTGSPIQRETREETAINQFATTGITVTGGGSDSPTALVVNTMPSYYTVIYIMKVA